MKRSCLVTGLVMAALAGGAWSVLDPQWMDTHSPPLLRGLALRGEGGGTALPAFVEPRLHGRARLAIPVVGIRLDQLTDTFDQPRGAATPIARESEIASPGGDAIPPGAQPSAPASPRPAEPRRHQALDIMAPLGTPVIAAAAGRVEKLHISKAGGNTVYIRSPDRRVIYYYAHLDRYAPALAEGAVVRPGTVLGTVGFTGNASPTGPHLHFAIMVTQPDRRWSDSATPVNPYELLVGR
jgi:murein DD-endopeptidase MepM/ murein hydrolase activator NlpD